MAMRCSFCGREQGPSARGFCLSCGRPLTATPASELFGRRYILNRLDDLARGGVLDADSAERVRRAMLLDLGEAPKPEPAAPVLPSPVDAVSAVESRAVPSVRPAVTAAVRERPAGPSPVETFFTPERAPSLLLYLGAFLVVVAALIFVNVSGQQISDSVRLALMIVGTLGFLGGGLVCHRIPRVEEAGRTFLIVGTLLVPLDFGAYYALVAHVSPFTSPAMWVLGSLVAAGLYAALAVTEYGRAYSYFFFIASLSALAGIAALLKVPSTWLFVLLAAYPLAIQLAARTGDIRTLRLVGPLDLPGRFLVGATIVFGAVPALIVSVFNPLSVAERLAIPALAMLGTAYYAARTDRDHPRERWLVVAWPAPTVVGLLFSADAPTQTYGFVSGVLAVAYTLVREVSDLAAAPSPFPTWVRNRARNIGYLLIAGAALPLVAYWRAPFLGATTYLGIAALLGVLAVWRAWMARDDKEAPELNALVIVGVGALHVGVTYLLVATGLGHAGVAVFSGIEPRALALGFTPIAGALLLLATIARRRLHMLADVGSVAGLASAVVVMSAAYNDPPLATVLAAVATAGAAWVAIDTRQPLRLWIAAAFAPPAAGSPGRWLHPSVEVRPPAIAAAALVRFHPLQ